MKGLRRLVLFLTAASLLLSAGCASSTTTGKNNSKGGLWDTGKFNSPGTFPICKETVELSVCLPKAPQVEDFATNTQTKLLEKEGNFKLNFTTLPQAEYHTKLNLMVASGGDDLADVLMGAFEDSQVYNYAMSGAIIPLTNYYKDAYYLKEAEKRTGVDFKPMITSPDGQIYGIARYNQSISNEYPAKMYMFQDWLDKLSLKSPTTPDELYNVLKAFKTKDPNGNGQQDEIPMVGNTSNTYWIEYLMNPFVYAGDSNYFTVDNGKIGLAYTTDEWKEGLKFIKKLVSEDLLSPLSFTQDNKGYVSMLGQQPTVVGSFVQNGPSSIPANDKRRTQYSGVAPLIGKNGTQYASYTPSVASIAMIISKNCKNPEAAFMLGDLLVSEEMSIHTRWGEKGVDYTEPKPGDISLYADLGYKPSLVEVLPWGKLQNKHWAQQGPYIRQYSISAGVVWSGDPLDTAPVIAKAQKLYFDKHPKEVIPKLIYTPEESDAVTETLSSLKNYVRESVANFATGAQDIDTQWDSYLKNIEGMGADDMLKNVQKAYDRMYKKK
ncbi:MAG: extracellular solute-binding protein [Bacillota bacterium]|nr:extracellular solute-binding protein [Bacillota bacterium]